MIPQQAEKVDNRAMDNDTQDRELLELAAKAAGYDFNWRGLNAVLPSIGRGLDQKWWNPLTDDGDALKLAVKLGINIRHLNCNSVEAYWSWSRSHYGSAVEGIGSLRNGDEPNAATRRAIVRAAAEIGKAMP